MRARLRGHERWIFRVRLRSARQLAAVAREAEWLYSGDTSEESFLRRVRALESAAMADRKHGGLTQ